VANLDEIWVPLVDEPIGSIVETIEEDDPDLRRLVASPRQLLAFRTRHFEYAVNYIEKKVDNPIATGGTPYVPWLHQLIEETKSYYLR